MAATHSNSTTAPLPTSPGPHFREYMEYLLARLGRG